MIHQIDNPMHMISVGKEVTRYLVSAVGGFVSSRVVTSSATRYRVECDSHERGTSLRVTHHPEIREDEWAVIEEKVGALTAYESAMVIRHKWKSEILPGCAHPIVRLYTRKEEQP